MLTLGIDFGTSSTVAVLGPEGGGAVTLLFGGAAAAALGRVRRAGR